MDTIKNLLEKKDNIIIMGQPGSGKGIVLKSILSILASNNKKVLILETLGTEEYKSITGSLGGNYLIYNDINSIDYSNKLTTISFSRGISGIEDILPIIKNAEDDGVEAVLIDSAYNYIKEYKKLNTNIHAQLIVSTQIDSNLLKDENLIDFKKVFKILFLMGQDNYIYPKLLNLYNIDKSLIKNLKVQKPFESMIIREGEVIKEKFKINIAEILTEMRGL